MTRRVQHPSATVIGRGGLLGSAIARELGIAGGPTGVDWGDGPLAASQLGRIARRGVADTGPDGWWVFWCAGTGYVGAGADALRAETELLGVVLDQLTPHASDGTIFFASSAGAIHAGGPNPSSETSRPSPLSAYGVEKLGQEDIVRSWCSASGGRAVIARIANLYGPGQNLSKPQGLISSLVRASLLSRPLTIFVPLETSRDYLFADDAARAIVDVMRKVGKGLPAGTTMTKIVASGRLTTIGTIVAELGRIRKKRPPVVFAAKPASVLQPRLVSLRSEVGPDLAECTRTTIPEGIAAVVRDQVAAMAAGGNR